MKNLTKVGVLGAEGRMGQAVISAMSETVGLQLTSALTDPKSPNLGRESALVTLTADITQAKDCDVMIDFSAPQASIQLAQALKGSSVKAIVSGTTGFTSEQTAHFHKACEGLALLQSGNFSLGVNMLEALVELAADKLRAGWDIDILEMHHRHKLDAPSGTALMLGEAAAKGRGVDLSAVQKLSREGQTGARPEGEIGFATLRGGGVIGEHSVKIASELEMLTLSHSAFDRSVFAQGALSAAKWAVAQPAGVYDMKDVLGL